MDGHYGFSQTVLRPLLVKGMDYASASVDSVYGLVSSAWKRDNGQLVYEVTVPGNTQALVCVPKNGSPARW